MEHITRCEEEVLMTVFRITDGASMQRIRDRVNRGYGHAWQVQTVSTFLRRLVQKGYLTMYRDGRTVYYLPEMPMEEYQRRCVGELCQVLFAGDTGAFAECVQEIGS